MSCRATLELLNEVGYTRERESGARGGPRGRRAPLAARRARGPSALRSLLPVVVPRACARLERRPLGLARARARTASSSLVLDTGCSSSPSSRRRSPSACRSRGSSCAPTSPGGALWAIAARAAARRSRATWRRSRSSAALGPARAAPAAARAARRRARARDLRASGGRARADALDLSVRLPARRVGAPRARPVARGGGPGLGRSPPGGVLARRPPRAAAVDRGGRAARRALRAGRLRRRLADAVHVADARDLPPVPGALRPRRRRRSSRSSSSRSPASCSSSSCAFAAGRARYHRAVAGRVAPRRAGSPRRAGAGRRSAFCALVVALFLVRPAGRAGLLAAQAAPLDRLDVVPWRAACDSVASRRPRSRGRRRRGAAGGDPRRSAIRGRWSRLLERASFAANALPGIVIALVARLLRRPLRSWLYQTLTLLVFAYVVRFLPQALAGSQLRSDRRPTARGGRPRARARPRRTTLRG